MKSTLGEGAMWFYDTTNYFTYSLQEWEFSQVR